MVKWKNLKDHYVKSLRTGRQYIHAEALSFLGTDFNFRRGGKVVTNAKSALRLGSLLHQTPNSVSSSSHSGMKRKHDPSGSNSEVANDSTYRYDDAFRDSRITFKLEPGESTTSDNDNSLSEVDGGYVYSGEPFENNGEVSFTQEADINILNGSSDIPENRHLYFFKGLLPSLQDFNDEETLDFQAAVINVLRNIKKQKV